MRDEKIKTLLAQADTTAGGPRYGPVSAAGIRSLARRRRIKIVVFPTAVAALLLLGVALWSLNPRTPASSSDDTERIAALEEQIRQLQVQSAETLRLVREVVAAERQQNRLVALEVELASIPDPIEQMHQQADETALRLVHQADHFYREMNQPQSAIETYEQVIRVFPNSPWADEARDRLTQIRTHRANQT